MVHSLDSLMNPTVEGWIDKKNNLPYVSSRDSIEKM